MEQDLVVEIYGGTSRQSMVLGISLEKTLGCISGRRDRGLGGDREELVVALMAFPPRIQMQRTATVLLRLVGHRR